MAQLTGYSCDNCGKTTDGGESLAGWIIVALKQPLPTNEDGSSPAQNTVAGDYHSVSCVISALEKAVKADTPRKGTRKKEGGAK